MSRVKRTSKVRTAVLEAWSRVYWDFILENEDKDLNWRLNEMK